jgi:hypothetical protein
MMEDEEDLWKTVKKYLFRKPTKEQLELKAKKAAIFRQQQIEQFETNQTWNFVYGLQKPKKSKEMKQLTNVTYRNIWMEPNFLYNQIVELNPDERFHDVSQYALQWQPPGSEFRLMIPLTDKQIQADAIKRLRFMTERQRSKVIFYFTPIKGDMELFAPRIHKSATESFHDRASVLKKLCEKYMQGVISVSDLHGILEAGYETWKMALYNVLDAEEQQFHRYLLKPPPKLIKKSLERQYLDDEITLQQYDDTKHPIRKAKKDEEALSYPRPYLLGKCVICQNEATGLIKCIDCNNLVCIECIQRVFLAEETSEGSFLLLHRKYCIKFGNLPKISVEIAAEPSYLHLLRTTGIQNTNAHLEHLKTAKRTLDANDFDEIEETLTGQKSRNTFLLGEWDEEEEKGDGNEEDDDSLFSSITLQLQQEIQSLLHIIEKCAGKIDSCLGTLREYQAVLDNPRRSQHLQERVLRLKNEKIEKISHTKAKIAQVRRRLKKYRQDTELQMQLQSKPMQLGSYPELLKSFEELEEKEGVLDRFIESKSLQEFHENELRLEEMKQAKAKSDLLMQYALKR